LCTLHFQKEPTLDNITSSLLFGDGAASVLVTGDSFPDRGLVLSDFYSEIIARGRNDMSWQLSSSGFQMTLSGYIPELLEEDFRPLVDRALAKAKIREDEISRWSMHPGGKRILDAICRSLRFNHDELRPSYETLRDVGNISSATILFALKKVIGTMDSGQKIFGAAFGPGLAMETFVATHE